MSPFLPCDGGKRDRNRGLIAVAHELCRVTYYSVHYIDDNRAVL